jgi:hypothetical protein
MISKNNNNSYNFKKDKILSVSADLFWEHGFLGTSVEQIAHEAKINKASIYYYFNDKASILYELACKSMYYLIQTGEEISKKDDKIDKKLQNFIINHICFVLDNLGVSGIGQIERKNLPSKLLKDYVKLRDKYEKLLRNILKEGIDQKKFYCADINLDSLLILGLMNSVVQWYNKNDRLKHYDIAIETSRFIINGLSSK